MGCIFFVFFLLKNMGLVSRVFFIFWGGEEGEKLMSAHFPPPSHFSLQTMGVYRKKSEKEDLLILFSTFSSAPALRWREKRERADKNGHFSHFFEYMRPRVFCHATSEIIFRLDRSFFSSWFLHMCTYISHLFAKKRNPSLLRRWHTQPFFFSTTTHGNSIAPFGSTQTRKDSKTYSSPSYYLSSPAREEKPFP